ncbi:hypothetical protein [Roseobacter sp. CCS2]|uniref:hypothetical protein n=1 Tax=Roseobacter sp. CCS2 TaxID=391593 RepID=UPI0000F4052D|nr:hypothetical protein [Roseobacter sp. CCS2]EBA13002.1 hypothetical protein RCCS2_03934 [Roseobacter sp. CCS2]
MHKTPIHLWIVGGLSLLWNAGGAIDYVMTRANAAAYMAAQPPERLAMLQDAPMWFGVTWAVGVWFSVIGSVLLLLRSRFAGPAFALSLLGLIGSSVYTYGIADGGHMVAAAGTAAIAFTVAIPVVLFLLWIYARAMTRRGVLR